MEHMSSGATPAAVAGVRKPYRAPVLVRYGDVRQLTQTGVSSGAENFNPSQNNCPPGQQAQPRFSCTASDRRMKQDIVRIGEHPVGFGLYLFEYRPEFRDTWGYGRQFGAMADEVERVMPEAVTTLSSGFKAVRYDMLGIRTRAH